MITAREFLATHPLSDSDAEAARTILAELDAFVRRPGNENATRIGCRMPIDPTRLNGIIADEIRRALKRKGWAAEFMKDADPAQIQRSGPGVQSQVQRIAVVTNFVLAIAPDDAARDAAEEDANLARISGTNGVSVHP